MAVHQLNILHLAVFGLQARIRQTDVQMDCNAYNVL